MEKKVNSFFIEAIIAFIATAVSIGVLCLVLVWKDKNEDLWVNVIMLSVGIVAMTLLLCFFFKYMHSLTVIALQNEKEENRVKADLSEYLARKCVEMAKEKTPTPPATLKEQIEKLKTQADLIKAEYNSSGGGIKEVKTSLDDLINEIDKILKGNL